MHTPDPAARLDRLALLPAHPISDTPALGHGPGAEDVLVRTLARGEVGAGLLATFLATYPSTTSATYRQRLGRFAAHLGVAPEGLAARLVGWGPAPTTVAVDRFHAALIEARCVGRDGRERPLSAATQAGYLNAVRAFVRYLERTHLIAWRLHTKVPAPAPYRDTRGPDRDVVRRLLLEAGRARDPRQGARDLALFSLYADWALRVSEPLGLDVEDVELDAAGAPVAIWVLGKGREARERFSLPPATSAALASWLRVRATLADGSRRLSSGGRPLFVALDSGAGRPGRGGAERPPVQRLTRFAVNDRLHRLAHAIGVARLTPHMLRHSAITAALDSGASIRDVQRFSRHADPRVVLRYDDNRQDIAGQLAARLSDEMRKAVSPRTPQGAP
jgi:integrase/recombinase XerC